MTPKQTVGATFALALLALGPPAGAAEPAPPPVPLRAAHDFSGIADPAARSAALFLEVSRVLLHPRCANCHPADDTPRQGMASVVHDPPVVRGPADRGVPALLCTSCHQDSNLAHARVPGAPGWHLAPIETAWLGRSPREVCEGLKRNAAEGGMTLDEAVEHVAHDDLVAWGWEPGSGREPAPGSAAETAALMRAWIDSGAVCPAEGAMPEEAR